ncbi:MAG: hypothetical protein F6J86_27660 [Symploca sp. SIO1B1]|nr:hypothetical protein [Symploca sp. SIO1B1]
MRLLQALKPVEQDYYSTTSHLWNWHLASHQNPDLTEITTGTEACSTGVLFYNSLPVELARCQSSKS